MDNIFEAERYTDRDLIQSILASFYIIDYGYIKKVNPDKSIDVVHAKMLKTMQGENLRPTTTKSVEVLTLSCGGFALQVDYKAGDKVLLLGLKDYVPNTAKVLIATETTSYMHYTQETLKALPLCVFNNSAKVQVKAENGTLDINATQNLKLNASQKTEIKGTEAIELNGNTKTFVTWEALNTALTNFMTSLVTALTTTPIAGNGSPQLTWNELPTSIDISEAQTTTIKTGG